MNMPFNKETAKKNGALGGKTKRKNELDRKNKRKTMSVKEVMLKLLEDPDNKEQLCKGLIESASKGNAKSAELLLKIIGEDPNKRQSVDENDPFS